MGILKIDSWFCFAFLFSILVVTMHAVCVSCHCQETERYHLLRLKGSLKLLNQSSDGKLVTWNNQSMDCCLWSGVGCSEDGKVVSLDLSGQGIEDGVDDSSSLFKLKNLESLNLAENHFNSTFPGKFDELINLNFLNLSYSGFSGQIPIGISSLMNLQILDISDIHYFYGDHQLSSIMLENPNLDTLIRNLSNLQELLLGGVKISAKDDNWGRAISSSLPNLRVLDLSTCDLKGSIDLSISNLRHLSEISLSSNNLDGVFPQEIFHLPSLRAIDLSHNEELQGSFPEISKNNSLEELVLSATKFSGGLPHATIKNLKSLARLDISFCYGFSGAIPKSLSNLTKLSYLDLSFNMFVGSIPSFTSLTGLTHLAIQENHLTGSIHSTHWEGLTMLKVLALDGNSLNGSIPMSLFRLPSLEVMFLNSNQFSDISNEYLNMSSFSSQLSAIFLSSNVISGPFPHFVFELTQGNIQFECSCASVEQVSR